MGYGSSYSPSVEETALTTLQTQQLTEQMALEDTLLSSLGYVKTETPGATTTTNANGDQLYYQDETGNYQAVTGDTAAGTKVFTFSGGVTTTDPETGSVTGTTPSSYAQAGTSVAGDSTTSYGLSEEQQTISDLNNEVTTESLTQELAGLKGELEVDSSVESDITKGKSELEASLYARLGPGAEGSDAWARAISEYDTAADALRYSVQTGQITNADALATSSANRSSSAASTASAVSGSSQTTANSLLSTYASQDSAQAAADAADSAAIGSAISGVTSAGMIGASILARSDERVKENIIDTKTGLDIIDKIRIVDFNYIEDPDKKPQQGVIAQELYRIFPQAVIPGNEKDVWMVDYGKLIPLMLKAIQELSLKVAEKNLLGIGIGGL